MQALLPTDPRPSPRFTESHFVTLGVHLIQEPGQELRERRLLLPERHQITEPSGGRTLPAPVSSAIYLLYSHTYSIVYGSSV